MPLTRDPLTPSSGGDYIERLRPLVSDLEIAQGELSRAWNHLNDVRWNGGHCIADMLPSDHPRVVAADARVASARERWVNAHAALVSFVAPGAFAAPLELRCGVTNWARGKSHDHCEQPAGHLGKHDFEIQSVQATDDQTAGTTP